MTAAKSGGCLCGQVKYSVNGPMRSVVACHCKQCQRLSGFHVAATSAAKDKVQIEGEVSWFVSSENAKRGFCGNCGSNLFWDSNSGNLSIFAGTLDAPTGLKLAGHIFCADKGDFYCLDDTLPKAAARNPSLTTRVD